MWIDISAAVQNEYRQRGWTRAWHRNCPQGSGGRMYTKGDKRSIYLPHIPINPWSLVPTAQQVDDFFNKLMSEIKRMLKSGKTVSPVLFQGGGTIPIPDWFRDFCVEHGITLKVLEPGDVLHADIGILIE